MAILLAALLVFPQCPSAETLDNIFHSISVPVSHPLAEKRSAILRASPEDKFFSSEKFQKFFARARNEPLASKLTMVNRFCNNIPYRSDAVAWRQKEYWATPTEFFNNGGDCEDFAIAKYALLRKLGIPDHQMRIICVKSMERGLFHAMLAVEAGNKIYILDNNYPGPRLAEDFKLKYFPLYSLNASQAWTHDPTAAGNKLKKKAEANLYKRKQILRETAKKLRDIDSPGER